MNKLKDKRIALALGGGAVFGAVHVGVLKALQEYDIKVSAISGTSAGAIAAALYAFGKTPKEMEDIILKIGWSDMSSFGISKYALLSNKHIGGFIKKHIGDKTFQEADIPLSIVATDISTGDKVVFESGSIADAVVASTCVPGIFIPMEIDGRLLVDGGISENIPLSVFKDKDIEFLIGVDLIPEHSHNRPTNFIEVLYNSYNFLIKLNKKNQTKQADIIIKPDLSRFNPTDMSQIRELIKKGYDDTTNILENF